jgi:hypothetical protein
MKTIELTPQEFYVFKQLTNNYYIIRISGGHVFVESEIGLLARLGY